jgi:hypothetical protein
MIQHFGDAYLSYKARVKALVPTSFEGRGIHADGSCSGRPDPGRRNRGGCDAARPPCSTIQQTATSKLRWERPKSRSSEPRAVAGLVRHPGERASSVASPGLSTPRRWDLHTLALDPRPAGRQDVCHRAKRGEAHAIFTSAAFPKNLLRSYSTPQVNAGTLVLTNSIPVVRSSRGRSGSSRGTTRNSRRTRRLPTASR